MKKMMFNDKYCLTEAVLNGNKTMTRRNLKIGRKSYQIGEIIAVAQSYLTIRNPQFDKMGMMQQEIPTRCLLILN